MNSSFFVLKAQANVDARLPFLVMRECKETSFAAA